ncbi:MAG: hypothetical protein ACRDIB_01585, partial [Ardenticatenaceae bacterium]
MRSRRAELTAGGAPCSPGVPLRSTPGYHQHGPPGLTAFRGAPCYSSLCHTWPLAPEERSGGSRGCNAMEPPAGAERS